jgi:hypothetical protein
MIGRQVDDDVEYMRTTIHALSGIRTHCLSVQAIKAYTSDYTATGTLAPVLFNDVISVSTIL